MPPKKNTASSFKNNKNLKPGDIFYYRIICEDGKTIAESGIAILRKPLLSGIWPYEGVVLPTNKVGLFNYDECVWLASMAE